MCSVSSSSSRQSRHVASFVNPILCFLLSVRKKMALKEWLKDISVPVYFLVIMFAMSSWTYINGLWTELPLLVDLLPEGWDLPSYIVILIQVANIGPLVFTIAKLIHPIKLKEWPIIYMIIATGSISCLLLAFLWDRTTVIQGASRSTALLVLAAFLSLVDCTSSVVYLPFMGMFKPQYMIAFYIGEGLCGLVPGIIGLIQGIGSTDCVNGTVTTHNETTGLNITEWKIQPAYNPPLFSVQVFFIILFVLIFFSGTAFTLLNFTSFCKKEMIFKDSDMKNGIELDTDKSQTNYVFDDAHSPEFNDTHKESIGIAGNTEVSYKTRNVEMWEYVWLLVVVAWVNGLINGVLTSTQSYSSLPYGNRAYNLSNRLSTVANPLACFLALFVSRKSLSAVNVLTFLGTVLAGYQLYLAAMSPSPPLQGETSGEALSIVTSVLLTAFFSYVKVEIAQILQLRGKKALLLCGAFTQVGSCIAAIITFVLVNVYDVFTASYADPCP